MPAHLGQNLCPNDWTLIPFGRFTLSEGDYPFIRAQVRDIDVRAFMAFQLRGRKPDVNLYELGHLTGYTPYVEVCPRDRRSDFTYPAYLCQFDKKGTLIATNTTPNWAALVTDAHKFAICLDRPEKDDFKWTGRVKTTYLAWLQQKYGNHKYLNMLQWLTIVPIKKHIIIEVWAVMATAYTLNNASPHETTPPVTAADSPRGPPAKKSKAADPDATMQAFQCADTLGVASSDDDADTLVGSQIAAAGA